MSGPILTKAEAAREATPPPVPRGVSSRELLDHAEPLAQRFLDGDAAAGIALALLIRDHAGSAV